MPDAIGSLLSSRWSVKITSFLKISSTQSYSKLRLGLKGSNQKLCFNWKRPKLWASSGPRLEFEGSKQEDGLLLNKTKAWLEVKFWLGLKKIEAHFHIMVSVGLAWALGQEPQAQHRLKKARYISSSTTDLTLRRRIGCGIRIRYFSLKPCRKSPRAELLLAVKYCHNETFDWK